jgi:hypothetical protein
MAFLVPGRRPSTTFSNQAADQAGRRDVKGIIRRRAGTRRNSHAVLHSGCVSPGYFKHLTFVALLDGDIAEAISDAPIYGAERQRDMERHAAIMRRQRL